MIKFVKAVFNMRPPVPRYSDTWDVSTLLSCLRSLSPVAELSLKMLTLKLVSLVALHVAARAHTLTCLDLNKMTKSKSKYCFSVGASDLKQSRPGYTPPLVELKSYPVDRRLCVYKVLETYIECTKHIRKDESRLFISYMKPHKKVTSSTISTWIKTAMAMAGVDVSVYKPHSIRSATTSKALAVGGNISQILKTAGWSNAGTFAKFYNKKINVEPSMGERVLMQK